MPRLITFFYAKDQRVTIKVISYLILFILGFELLQNWINSEVLFSNSGLQGSSVNDQWLMIFNKTNVFIHLYLLIQFALLFLSVLGLILESKNKKTSWSHFFVLVLLTASWVLFLKGNVGTSSNAEWLLTHALIGISICYLPQSGKFGLRYIQLQFCLLYFSAALHKIISLEWQTGEAIFLAFSNPEFMTSISAALIQKKILLKISTYFSLLIEVFAPFFLWTRFRHVAVFIVIFFHIIIEITMNIPLFEWVSIAMALSFVNFDKIKFMFSKQAI